MEPITLIFVTPEDLEISDPGDSVLGRTPLITHLYPKLTDFNRLKLIKWSGLRIPFP